MNVGALGEFALIDRIASLVSRTQGRQVVLGIGDDAAVLRPSSGSDLVITTDAFVQGIHFRFDQESARIAGRRAMVANLSDLAAMGARPIGSTLALALPEQTLVKDVLALVRGLLFEAEHYGCPLVGGNVTRSKELSLTITALGEVRRGSGLRRDGARAGDRVIVSGVFGRSALERARGRIRHIPRPRLALGQSLAKSVWAGGCLDVSDGLDADLSHMAQASQVDMRVNPRCVPTPKGFARACAALGVPSLALALAGGEDWELAFSVRPDAPPTEVLAKRLKIPLREIGTVVKGAGRVHWESSSPLPELRSWRHF